MIRRSESPYEKLYWLKRSLLWSDVIGLIAYGSVTDHIIVHIMFDLLTIFNKKYWKTGEWWVVQFTNMHLVNARQFIYVSLSDMS